MQLCFFFFIRVIITPVDTSCPAGHCSMQCLALCKCIYVFFFSSSIMYRTFCHCVTNQQRGNFQVISSLVSLCSVVQSVLWKTIKKKILLLKKKKRSFYLCTLWSGGACTHACIGWHPLVHACVVMSTCIWIEAKGWSQFLYQFPST